jgi:hypothetical protein
MVIQAGKVLCKIKRRHEAKLRIQSEYSFTVEPL